MNSCRWIAVVTLAVMTSLTHAHDAAAQEIALKGGVSVSRLEASAPTYWDDRLTTTFFGIHARFRFGPIGLQPELMIVTKGASASQALEQEQIRLEYLEVPLLLVVPLSMGQFEPFVYAGPALMLESRCRWFFREQGLRRNLGCDPPRDEVFRRKFFDYGAIVGGGAAYPLGPGRVSVEARHNWGLRNVHRDQGPELRNRTFSVMLGYSLNWEPSS
jgi:hypothetical protein